MLSTVLKSVFGYDDFKSDIQKQATSTIYKGLIFININVIYI